MANEQNLVNFKKGYDPRRNKNGSRPSATTILNKLLAGKISKEDAAGKIHTLDKDEAIWVNIIADALDEDEDPTVRHRAANMIFDRLYGKPTQPIDHSGSLAIETADALTTEQEAALKAAMGL